MSTPRKTKRPVLGSKVIQFSNGGRINIKQRGELISGFYPTLVAIMPVTRGKKKARAK